jgi:hypothetical protein
VEARIPFARDRLQAGRSVPVGDVFERLAPLVPYLGDEDHVRALDRAVKEGRRVLAEHGGRERPELLAPLDAQVDPVDDPGPARVGEDAPPPQRPRSELGAVLEPGDDFAPGEEARRREDEIRIAAVAQSVPGRGPLPDPGLGGDRLPVDGLAKFQEGREIRALQTRELHGARRLEPALEETDEGPGVGADDGRSRRLRAAARPLEPSVADLGRIVAGSRHLPAEPHHAAVHPRRKEAPLEQP